MKILSNAFALQVILGSWKNYKGVTQYRVIYGASITNTEDYEHALNMFHEYCAHSAICENLIEDKEVS